MAILSASTSKLNRSVRYCIFSILAGFAAIYFIDSRYEKIEVEGHHFYDNAAQKIWAHRGYVKTHPENTIAAFQEAIDKGAPGIELDIFFNPETKAFLVSHDPPTPDAPELHLETVFLEFGEKIHYWLDFKNLADLSFKDAASAAHLIATMATRYTSRPLIMVESTDASKLALFKHWGVHTALWASLDPRNSWLMRQYHILKTKYLLGAHGIPAASFYIRQFDPSVPDVLPNTDIYVFTINEVETARELAALPSVKIILTDEDLYSLNSP